MGSTKHIRNNGEHLNIHGHDNYQMPGAYKQMGDMNQNQPAKYDDGPMKELKGDQDQLPIELQEAIKAAAPEQPGKISGGASKYIKEAYGADKIGDPDPPTKPTPAETAKSINKFSKSVYDAGYNATKGRGGHSNFEYEKTAKELGFTNSQKSPGLPQGVFQDYSNSGGNKSPRVAKDILTKAARFASSETGNPGFRKKGASGWMNRSYYSPSEGFSGVDTQTGKATNFNSAGGSSEVKKHSNAFQKNMRFGISRSGKTAQEGNEIKQKGLVNAPKPKASVLEKGPNKDIHSSKSKGINKILKIYKK